MEVSLCRQQLLTHRHWRFAPYPAPLLPVGRGGTKTLQSLVVPMSTISILSYLAPTPTPTSSSLINIQKNFRSVPRTRNKDHIFILYYATGPTCVFSMDGQPHPLPHGSTVPLRHVHTPAHIHPHVCTTTQTHTKFTYAHTHMHMCTFIHTCPLCIYAHTYTVSHLHEHTHTHTLVQRLSIRSTLNQIQNMKRAIPGISIDSWLTVRVENRVHEA